MKSFRMFLGSSLFLMLCAAGALAQTTQTDYDRAANLSRFKSFGFAAQLRAPGDPLATNPINDRRIHDALQNELNTNGFVLSTEPDFWIAYAVTTRKGLNIQDNRYGLFQRLGNVNVNEVTEGTLIVVFTNSASGQEVWRGYVSGEINPKNLDKDVTRAIAKLIQKFKKNQAGQR